MIIMEWFEFCTSGLMSLLCLFGVAANTLTIFVLNGFSEMRRQSINVYLTMLAIFDNGVLINAFLMLYLPAIVKGLEQLLYEHHSSSTIEQQSSNNYSFNTNFTTTNSATIVYDAYYEQNLIAHSGNNTHTNSNGTNSIANIGLPDDDDFSLLNYSSSDLMNNNKSLYFIRNQVNDNFFNCSLKCDHDDDDDDNNNTSDLLLQLPLHLSMMNYYIAIVYPMALISQTGSVWTTCLITAERYFAVCHPIKMRTIMTQSKAIWAVCLVSISAIIYNIPRFYEVKTETINGIKIVIQTDLRKDPVYYKLYFIFAYFVLMYIIPLSVLSLANVKIYRAIKRANQYRASLTNHEESELNIASMLVLLVSIFLACNAPAFLVNVLELIDKNHDAFKIATQVSNLLICVNSSVNFVIYCIFGKKFRQKLRQTICWKKSKIIMHRKNSRSILPTNSTHFVDETFV